MSETDAQPAARTALTLTLSQRERGHKRRAIKLLLFLLAGAIVNVAVAWGCAAFGRVNTYDPLLSLSDADRFDVAPFWLCRRGWEPTPYDGYWHYRLHGRIIKGDGLHFQVWEERGELRPVKSHRGFVPSNTFGVEVSAGWPSFAIFGAAYDSRDTERAFDSGHILSIATGLPVLKNANTYFAHQIESERLIPYLPLWPGFAINTIFYAAVLWVLFAVPGKVRRWRRIKRGQCAACGYSLRNSVSEKCPECGAAARTETIVR